MTKESLLYTQCAFVSNHEEEQDMVFSEIQMELELVLWVKLDRQRKASSASSLPLATTTKTKARLPENRREIDKDEKGEGDLKKGGG